MPIPRAARTSPLSEGAPCHGRSQAPTIDGGILVTDTQTYQLFIKAAADQIWRAIACSDVASAQDPSPSTSGMSGVGWDGWTSAASGYATCR